MRYLSVIRCRRRRRRAQLPHDVRGVDEISLDNPVLGVAAPTK
ncbi:hypothetical protein I545_0772 [Mycobacterium kansasii 662]|uniref:Uncharacterized protein n=2 Tax=Mycobacterium kansasii TaxID=1768 RepID=A0A1V3Y0M5_MYCKA|nr:hypothetical protein I547_0549 [Mycobacterium kansasii 824]EUA20968.1 hypothetical protein I545_0772 [Mycobacterium kansasii 662]KEP43306.1 hypothetical protein MKSMC1_16930 [Mycobacterium kansasii]OOK82420.1 hypothetical protein BZL30_0991 [Mycobacterium kansasii]OOK84291.1 hypothetical protein BZL29_0914 [Mycobacterium kansasii]